MKVGIWIYSFFCFGKLMMFVVKNLLIKLLICFVLLMFGVINLKIKLIIMMIMKFDFIVWKKKCGFVFVKNSKVLK